MKWNTLLIMTAVMAAASHVSAQESLRDFQDRTGLNPNRTVPLGSDQHGFYRSTSPQPPIPVPQRLPSGLTPRAIDDLPKHRVAIASSESKAHYIKRHGEEYRSRKVKEQKEQQKKEKLAALNGNGNKMLDFHGATLSNLLIEQGVEAEKVRAAQQYDRRQRAGQVSPSAPAELRVPRL